MFESWHDPMDCHYSDCTLEAKTDTATFKYSVRNNKIIFSEIKYKDTIAVTIDISNKRIVVDDYPLRVNDESVNWDEINKIIGR